ncbi:conjugal transfer protein TraO [Plesiomonas sp. ZOR0011]|uniref:conjugal transfer protein TraO n=1 Tax=Plesiomonas sp. ZOR0011 TaxID=1339230 RepID=UPI00068B68F2|nr:conjugal transfer protein TraO [Plesiomonas sp. ZOR0011]
MGVNVEKDVSRDVKKTGAIIVAAVLSLSFGIYLLISWMNTPPPAASRINVDNTLNGTGKDAPESPHYRKVLKESNAEGAKLAQQNNTSFIASLDSGTIKQELPITPPPVSPPPQTTSVAYYPPQPQPVPAPGIDPDQKKALEALIKEMVTQRAAPTGQLATVAGVVNGQGGGNNAVQVNPYAEWTESLSPTFANDSQATTGPSGKQDRVIIPAGSRPGGVIDTAIDSDNTSSQVIARIPAGKFAGAMLMSNGVQLAGDGVSIHFTKMTWNQDTWRVDVWAAMPDSLQSSVASSVNNRYATRILLPAIAHGLGLGGQLYASANTQILSNGMSTIEGRVGMPDGKAVAGTILGGAAQQAGQVVANDAQKLPVKQVIVERGQSIALLFMSAVKESDRETNTPTENTFKPVNNAFTRQ